MDIFDFLELVEVGDEELLQQQNQINRQRIIRPRSQFFNSFDDVGFFKRFRLTKTTALIILQKIESKLVFPSNRLITLYFFLETLGTLFTFNWFNIWHYLFIGFIKLQTV